jgi:carbonic anhydrase
LKTFPEHAIKELVPMQKLVQGLHIFQENIFTSKRDLFEHLSCGQQPDALFITCSDSRINPNLLTQAEPGELFIIRNAGNLMPAYGATNGGEGATLEYAVTALGIKDIIVCGHSDCGAMKGLLHPENLTSMPSVEAWLKQAETTRRIVRENYAGLTEDELLAVTIKENVLVQLENLRTHPAVAVKLAKGELRLHAWVYKINSGEVIAYESERGQFVPLGPVPRGVPAGFFTHH